MLFSSYQFILLFLPVCLVAFAFFKKSPNRNGLKLFLLLASLFFYSVWKFEYLFIILSSIIINYFLAQKLFQQEAKSKILLIFGITFNLLLLAIFKYLDFTIFNINYIFNTNIPLLRIVLPLAISFFTFQQIAFLVDAYKGLVKSINFLNYALFVTFFPQLIAGPIVHHKEMMPQFDLALDSKQRFDFQEKGLFLFAIGLFKKIFIADYFAVVANSGFDGTLPLNFSESWMTSLSYTFQLYFDFSGYSDMAIGLGLIFGIKLPQNFHSPYKAVSIQDFWRRWHMTLSQFLRDYLYIPLGGSRCSEIRVYRNLFLTFFLGGLWHGASWMFIIWGSLHGTALIIHRVWQKQGLKMPKFLAILMTFMFANICWVFFRATNLDRCKEILLSMISFEGGFKIENIINPSDYANYFLISIIMIWFSKNSFEIIFDGKDHLKTKHFLLSGLIILLTLLKLFRTNNVEFIYFNF